jgi:hypothetical protein
VARWRAVVVFPTPPLNDATVIIITSLIMLEAMLPDI